jgi:hypothetical protein
VTCKINTPDRKKVPKHPWDGPRFKDTPHAWLRRLICSYDFGAKATGFDDAGNLKSRPVHCNKNVDILAAFRDNSLWRTLSRLSKKKLDDHWSGRETYYFVGHGSSKKRFTLVNLDIDCHASGTPQGAAEAAEHLKANFFPGLYYEPSTNGRGVHGYFILDKGELGSEGVKPMLKCLERCLNGHLLAAGFDIEFFEIKGLPPDVRWGEDGRVSNFKAGVLAKIPRQVHRYEEWKRTTILTDLDIRRLTSKLYVAPLSGAAEPRKPSPAEPKVTEDAHGSMTGKIIGDEELAQIAKGGLYRRIAAGLLENHRPETSGRSIVTAEDVAIFLLCLKFLTSHMNADGTMPTRRFGGLWKALYEAGDVGRAFDCHRFKAIRDCLSDFGLLDWEDHTFVVPRVDECGMKHKGRACKWKASDRFMEMLEWSQESSEEAGLRGQDDRREEREEEASFVGTTYINTVSLEDNLTKVLRSLARVPEGEETRPVELSLLQANPLREYTPEEITDLILNCGEPEGRFAA